MMLRRIWARVKRIVHEYRLAQEALSWIREMPFLNTFSWEKEQHIERIRIELITGDVSVGVIEDKIDIKGQAEDTLDVTLRVAFTIKGVEQEACNMLLVPVEELEAITETIQKFRRWRK